MNDNFSLSQTVRKPAVVSERGVVSAQHRVAALAGAAVLARGGDCIDAAVATSFALGALEPWMSGAGGLGTMVVYRAKEKRFEVIDFGGVSPQGLNAKDFPLDLGGGAASDLFPWARVKGDRNIHGPTSVVVPGVVAGMGEAHKRYGKLAWRELVMPAAQFSRDGLLVDWFTTENIAAGAADLRRYPIAAEEFLRDGLPPTAMWGIKSRVTLPRPKYAKTLEWIAEHGAESFYRGELARTIAAEMQAAGGALRASDLEAYQARVLPSLAIPYRNSVVHATPELTAGPTLAQTLKLLSAWTPNQEASSAKSTGANATGTDSTGTGATGPKSTGRSAPDAQAYAAYGRALQAAYRQRLADMGDADGKRAIGAEHLAPSCTSHFNVVDAQGNMVAVTQTLLGIFGSKFVTPQTGILMNNGVMWFDPEPGKTNSIAGGQRCLSNYTPAIAAIGDGRMMAVGASGGRRILPAVAQLISFAIDYGMDLDTAFHTPRIDASEGPVLIGDVRMPEAFHAALAREFDYEQARVQTLPMKFACPSAAMRGGGSNSGAAETFQPWADAVAG
jgi:gamma-glutamyltranspeptidase / glutathione hydrolase